MEDYSALVSKYNDCVKAYEYYSDAADQSGYHDGLEDGISQIVRCLEYIRDTANTAMRDLLSDGKTNVNDNNYMAYSGLKAESEEYINKTEDLRNRKQSIFAKTEQKIDNETTRIRVKELLDFLFSQDWFCKYTESKDVDALLDKGLSHSIFNSGKHKKIIQPYMLNLDEMDLIINGLLCFYAYDEIDFNKLADDGVSQSVDDMIKAVNEAGNDPRLFKTVYNRHGNLFHRIIKETGH